MSNRAIRGRADGAATVGRSTEGTGGPGSASTPDDDPEFLSRLWRDGRTTKDRPPTDG